MLGAVGLLAPWPAAGQGRCEAPVRGLVARSTGPVDVVVDGRRHVVAPSAGGVRVDRGRARSRWSPGPMQVGGIGGGRFGGRFEAFVHERALVVVNEVGLEEYVAGAIAGEMPTGWAEEALRAQAVVSRTYALHQRDAHRDRAWHLEAGTRSQVYVGLEAPEPAQRAARDTRCQVLTHDGTPILAAFHSASGGHTASAGEVWGRDLDYLVDMPVTGEDDSPDTYWRAAISRPTLGRALGAAGHPIGEVVEAVVEARTPSGRVRWIRFRGERGEVRLTGRQLRRALGESTLRSTLFELRSHDDDFVFVGSGRGHGVGMSQWGARGLAERGATYREILEQFYPGARLGAWTGSGTAGLRPPGR
jgi:stage II sporulation protein D